MTGRKIQLPPKCNFRVAAFEWQSEGFVMTRLRAAVCAVVLVLGVPVLGARDFHMTVEGAGSRDGRGWENALAGDRLQTVFDETIQPGDRLLLGGGTYPSMAWVISSGGAAGRPKELLGVDRGAGLPLFAGNWSVENPSRGATAIRIAPGVSHISLQGIRLRGYVYGVHAPASPEAGRSNLRFGDVGMEQLRHGFYLADCDDVQFRACLLKRYTKHGFRFEQGCDRVTLQQCVADCSEGDTAWETRTELFPFGYLVNGGGSPNTEFFFEDCVARNHLMPLQTTKYPNGDGFVVEANAAGVQFVRCRALRNQDGGFDLKVPEVRLTDCVAAGNFRGFRIWSTGTLENCLAGWGTVGLWNNGGPVTATRCTFHELKDAAVLTDDKASQEVTLTNCLISAAAKAHRKTAQGNVVLRETVTSPGAGDAGYPRAEAAWDGLGNAMDSTAHPGKGYRSPAASKPLSK